MLTVILNNLGGKETRDKKWCLSKSVLISPWGIKNINQNLMLTQSSRPINKSMFILHFWSKEGCFTEPPLHNWILTNVKSPLRNNKLSSVSWRANIFHVCYTTWKDDYMYTGYQFWRASNHLALHSLNKM